MQSRDVFSFSSPDTGSSDLGQHPLGQEDCHLADAEQAHPGEESHHPACNVYVQ